MLLFICIGNLIPMITLQNTSYIFNKIIAFHNPLYIQLLFAIKSPLQIDIKIIAQPCPIFHPFNCTQLSIFQHNSFYVLTF